jgi:hypothetical protein
MSRNKCPWIGCTGKLTHHSTHSTLMGYAWGTDTNRQTEFFKCDECSREFSRSYKWECAEEMKKEGK